MADHHLGFRQLDELKADEGRYSFSFRTKIAEEELSASLALLGQASPLLGVETPEGITIVDGAARLHLMKKAGRSAALVALLPHKEVWSSLLAWRKAQNNPLNPVETGLYLKKRMADTGESLELLAESLFPLLSLPPKPQAAEDFLWLAGLSVEDAERFASGEAPFQGIRVLSSAPPAEALTVLKVTRGKRLSSGKFMETARWLMECAWREGVTVEQWLENSGLDLDWLSGNDFRDALWRLRYPTIAAWSDSFDGDAAKVALPKEAALSHATGFEGGRLRLTVSFSSVAGLEKTLGKLATPEFSASIERMAKYLG